MLLSALVFVPGVHRAVCDERRSQLLPGATNVGAVATHPCKKSAEHSPSIGSATLQDKSFERRTSLLVRAVRHHRDWCLSRH